jgi:hypothetical protein
MLNITTTLPSKMDLELQDLETVTADLANPSWMCGAPMAR